MQTKLELFIRVMFAFRGWKKLNCLLLQWNRIEPYASASNISAYKSETRQHCGLDSYNYVERNNEFGEISSKLVNFHAYWRAVSVCN